MKALKVEWVYDHDLYDNGQLSASAMEQVVRLTEVDKVLTEAVWAMEQIVQMKTQEWTDLCHDNNPDIANEDIQALAVQDADFQRAQAFLAGPLVQDHLERTARQKKEVGHEHESQARD